MFGFLFSIFFTLFLGFLGIGGIVQCIKDKASEFLLPGLICMILFIVCIFGWIIDPPSMHRSCCGIIEWNVSAEDFCGNCGAELIPHCIECGEVCKTAFCKLCGAEQ